MGNNSKKSGNFRADVYHDGKRMRKTSVDNLNDAEVLVDLKRQALKNGQPVPQKFEWVATTKNTFKTMADRTFNL